MLGASGRLRGKGIESATPRDTLSGHDCHTPSIRCPVAGITCGADVDRGRVRDQIVRDRPSGGLAERVSNQVVAVGGGPAAEPPGCGDFRVLVPTQNAEPQDTNLDVGGSSPPSVQQEQEGGIN